MKRPTRYLIRMGIFLGIVTAAVAVLFPSLQEAFVANAVMNGMILGVLGFGIIYIFRQVLSLQIELTWLNHLKKETQEGVVFAGAISEFREPRLLGPMATMIGEKKGKLSLSTLSMRTLLDGIQARIEESHEISRYLIGLLIFLGLLGTFWGLLGTVNAVGDTIAGLSATADDPSAMFDELKSGLQTPLSGMGTAFSSSLFGLAGSLVLGFLELQAGQAHNRFLNYLEEWLSGVTKLSSGSAGVEGDQSVPAYISALLEQTAESLEKLQRTMSRDEDERVKANHTLVTLTERMSTLTDHMRAEQSVMLSIAETQSQLKPILAQLAQTQSKAVSSGLDEASKGHIRNMDLRLEKLSGDILSGRESSVQEIRSEIRLLTRTLAAMAETE
ncbi:flagellar motor protein MotA [Kiloniella laminariae]|uniref:Flagellar motor protein MotA n=1 Tax=Kiloniella laminariae TaxID=454162 RepID=A0ABT4LIR1_9PROT|nr:flagellar motor protein MotA [Kiloniella laminariae]MCZ4280830.1 flagellar motor protein MotA [Kiloniella laminariae]